MLGEVSNVPIFLLDERVALKNIRKLLHAWTEWRMKSCLEELELK